MRRLPGSKPERSATDDPFKWNFDVDAALAGLREDRAR